MQNETEMLEKEVFKHHQPQNKLKTIVLGLLACSGAQCGYSADEQFNDALRNAGNPAALEQYRYSMQNDALGYYPEYWILNYRLSSQSPSAIVDFAKRYPQSAMAEKLAADYVEEKVKIGDYTSAQPVLPYVTNADQAESCAMAQVRVRTGDPLVMAEFKDVWLATNSQPESCNGLGRLMQTSPMMT